MTTPTPPATERRQPVDVTVETVVHRPLDAVAAYLFEPATRVAWRGDAAAVRHEPQAGPGSPGAVGSRFATIQTGRKGLRVDEVTELVPLDRMTVTTVSGGPPLTETITLRPDGEASTLVTLRTVGDSRLEGLPGRVASSLLARAVRRDRDTDLARAKTILELLRP